MNLDSVDDPETVGDYEGSLLRMEFPTHFFKRQEQQQQLERPIEKWLKSDLRSIFGRDSEARTKGNQGDRDRLGEIKKRLQQRVTLGGMSSGFLNASNSSTQ